MVEEPHYTDDIRRLNLKINEVAESELIGKDTIRRDILCEILKIPKDYDVRTKDQLIREALVPICFKRNTSLGYIKHQLLCNHFHIPIYHRPKIDILIKFKILEVLVKESPRALFTREIAEILGESKGKVSAVLCNSYFFQNPWIKRIIDKGEKRPYKWKATESGIEAYNNGDARQLKKKKRKMVPPGTLLRPRRCTMKAFKVLEFLVIEPCACTAKAIAKETGMEIMVIQDILKYDYYSKLPFFVKMTRKGAKKRYRYQASKAGIEYYYRHIRKSVEKKFAGE
jgi:hypothetical protein